MTLAGKLAIITSAGSGIGRAAARLSAEKGECQVLTARRQPKVWAVVDQPMP